MPVYGSHLISYDELKLGHRIREERQRRGWTLSTLAAKTRISIARLSQIENSKHVPDLRQAFAIADALGIPRSSLFPSDARTPYEISRAGEVRRRDPADVLVFDHRNGHGDRRHHNQFWPLANLFVDRHLEPQLARIMPLPDNLLQYYSHDREEFVFVLKGSIEFLIRTPQGLRREHIHRGDCIFFRSSFPHCLRSLKPEPAECIDVLCGGGPIDLRLDGFASRAMACAGHDGCSGESLIADKVAMLCETYGWLADRLTKAGFSEQKLRKLQRGEGIPLDVMLELARVLGRPLTEFIALGDESDPFYFIQRSEDIPNVPCQTRRIPVEQPDSPSSKSCQPLASGFPKNAMFPYFIKLRNVDIETLTTHEHHGEEFIYVLDGELELVTCGEGGQLRENLRAGDSCYIDSSVPHLVRGQTLNPYSETSAEVIDVFWCPLGEGYLFK